MGTGGEEEEYWEGIGLVKPGTLKAEANETDARCKSKVLLTDRN